MPPDLQPVVDSFMAFIVQTGYRFRQAEVLVCSPALGICTQVDTVVEDPNDHVAATVNWKTGNGLYEEAALQAAAERAAWADTFGDRPSGALVVRLGKARAEFEARWANIVIAEAAFQCAQNLWQVIGLPM